jgi:hypothetical protein
MLAAAARPAKTLPFPVAAAPLSAPARQALRPARLGRPWQTAAWLDAAADRLDLAGLHRLYRRRGSLPFPPLLMLKLALFGMADGRPSPNDWAELANRDGPARWLAWGLEPSASACYAFRDRLGLAHLLDLNRQVLALAQQDGLSPATSGALDGTLTEACASRHRLANQGRLQRGLELLQQQPPPSPEQADPAPAPAPAAPAPAAADVGPAAADAWAAGPAQAQVLPADAASQGAAPAAAPAAQAPRRPVRPGRTEAGRRRQQRRWQRAQAELLQRQRRNQDKRASKRADPAKLVVSPTDPEAAVGRDKRGVFRPLYNDQLVADLDSELILGYEAFAQPNDNGLLPVMLERAERLLGHKLGLVLVDAGYTGGQELAAAEQAAVAVLGPCAGQGGAAKKSAKQIPKEEFRYAAGRDVYVCPQGKALGPVGRSRQKRSSVELVLLTEYRAAPGECPGCPRKDQCCPKSRQGRSISRSEHQGAIDRLRERMSRPENQQTYKRRAATVERLFGDGKEYRGLGRVPGRGLERARIHLALMVLQHNLRVLGRAMEAAKKEKDAPPQRRRGA